MNCKSLPALSVVDAFTGVTGHAEAVRTTADLLILVRIVEVVLVIKIISVRRGVTVLIFSVRLDDGGISGSHAEHRSGRHNRFSTSRQRGGGLDDLDAADAFRSRGRDAGWGRR
jgi:hypothetical protein